MSLIRRGASPDLPFAELSPEDFHRLALHLLDREPSVTKVENYGASGSDGGVDLLADLDSSALAVNLIRRSVSLRTIVQVKRVKSFGASEARTELARLRRSGKHEGFDHYLLFTSCMPSAPAIDTLRRGCRELGIEEVTIWDRSLLTARLLRHRDLIEFFFGLSGDAESLAPGSAQRYLSAKRLVGAGHRLVLAIGSQPEFDFAPMVGGASSSPGEVLRWLIENRVVDQVLAHGSDFSLTLGDLLALRESPGAPREAALWQPGSEFGLGVLLEELLAGREPGSAPPVLALMGLDPRQTADVAASLAAIEARLAAPPLFFGTPEPGPNPLSAVSASGQSFLRSLQELIAPDWLVLHLEKLDFSRPYAFEDILSGRTVKPGVVHSGFWKEGSEETETKTGSIPIAGLSGTGKTARAFRIGFELCPDSTFYLDLAAFPELTTPDLTRVMAWLEEEQAGDTVLILDNAQAAPGAVDQLPHPARAGRNTLYLVTVTTHPFASLEMLGGEIQPEVLSNTEWKAERAQLARWCLAQGASEGAVRGAEQSASNLWHFFYLLRGGADRLATEIERSRGAEMGDVVWYAIAAIQVFGEEVATVRRIYAEIAENGLWPLTVEEGRRGPWLVDRVIALLDAHVVVAVADGFVCRHPFDAFGVLRLCFERDNQLTPKTFREASIRMFAEAMPRIEIPPEMHGDPAELAKKDFLAFGRYYLNDVLARQRELEQAVASDPRLQDAVDQTWSELIELVEAWPVHPLYWLFNYAGFTDNLMRFSPFQALRRVAAFDRVESDSDAIDIEYAVKGMVAYEALRTARTRHELGRLREDMKEHLDQAEGFVLMLTHLRDQGLAAGKPADPERETEIAAMETMIEKMKKRLADDGTLVKLNRETVVIPFETQLAPSDPWGLDQSTGWLEYQTRHFAQVADNVDRQALIASMSELGSSRPLLLAHLWLLSRGLGEELYALMPPAWRQEVIERVAKSVDSFTQLHLSGTDDCLAIFVSELAAIEPEIAAWLGRSDAEELAERIASANRRGLRCSSQPALRSQGGPTAALEPGPGP